ncbi:hypothetical protein J1614_004589 [Plenodomus biglobosus]|nr:hypothetical protein J1614_004589 [Plenodomus biglobosus]
MQRPRKPRRQIDSIVLHFDYDCFYASVFEHENPFLKTLPLAVQQKQIVVTCNYEARRRGLYKLQLIVEAKKICPDVVIVLGEDLTRFRNASKQLYAYFRSFSWNSRCERLGFDEVFMDVSDMIEYNVAMLGPSTQKSFFLLSRDDPTVGFEFDATRMAGHVYPQVVHDTSDVASTDHLYIRLLLASHLAQYLRTRLEEETGYTATVGISTNKLLSKLVGNQHKPNAQTTLLPPYLDADETGNDNVTAFIDEFEVGKLPGIGFKIAQQLRSKVLGREAGSHNELVHSGIKDHVLVRHIRSHPGMSPNMLERILEGPGTPQGIGARVWGLLNGSDDSEVGKARDVPKQISIEDSYIRLDTLDEVIKELTMLAKSLLKRMYTDLLEDDSDDDGVATDAATSTAVTTSKRWLAHPRTIRLSTRSRPPQNPDGSRNRSFGRTSRSAPMPNFALSLKENMDTIVEKLVDESLLPLFRKLHPEKKGWNLSLVNIAATNMADAASEKGGVGRDIGKMFRRQDHVLKQWKAEERAFTPEPEHVSVDAVYGQQLCMLVQRMGSRLGSEDMATSSQEAHLGLSDSWASEDDGVAATDACCDQCGAVMPVFAMGPHARWHEQMDRQS